MFLLPSFEIPDNVTAKFIYTCIMYVLILLAVYFLFS